MNKHDTLILACGSALNRQTLRSVFEENFNILEADNSTQAMMLLQQNHECVGAVLIDITISSKIDREVFSNADYRGIWQRVPAIVILAEPEPSQLEAAFRLGAVDAIPLDYDPIAMRQRVHNIVDLNIHKLHLEEMVAEQAESIRHTNERMVDALSSIIEHRSVESGQHIFRIRRFTRVLLDEVAGSCPEYNLSPELISVISSAAALHDIGKISIPDSILNKPGKLSDEEMELMRTHTVTGCKILESLQDIGDREYLRYAHNICHYHHERWDGGGYPEGLSGDNIPICAQIVGLADVYDALTTKRVYKEAFSFDTAMNMIVNGECGLFSPKLLECFKHVRRQLEDVAKSYSDGVSPKTEHFDAVLPAQETKSTGALDSVRIKYTALLHYVNAFLAEVSPKENHYHLIYNPYPELSPLRDAGSFHSARDLVLQRIVAAEDSPVVAEIFENGIAAFMQASLRRQTHHFKVRSANGGTKLFEMSLLRPGFEGEFEHKFLLILREAEDLSAGSEPIAESAYHFSDENTYTCLNDKEYSIRGCPDSICSLSGYSPRELDTLFGNSLLSLVLPVEQESVKQSIAHQLSVGREFILEYHIHRRSGSPLWVLNKAHLVTDDSGTEFIRGTLTDISASKRSYDELKEKHERYEIILTQTENTLFELDIASGEISLSDTWEHIFGSKPSLTNMETIVSTGSVFHPDDSPRIISAVQELAEGASYRMAEARIATSTGRYLWCRLRASLVRRDGKPEKIVGVIINIDAEKRAELLLQDQAERDALTKLLNKNTSRSKAIEYLSEAEEDPHCALIIIDLDNFKYMNDHYGHMFGDSVLTRAAQEIKRLFRSHDIVGRIGGDEFMVLMRDVDERELVERRCRTITEAFRNLFSEQLQDCPLACSIGVALAPEHGRDYYELFDKADRALYQAKKRGKNGFVIYDHGDSSFSDWFSKASVLNERIDSDEQPGLANSSLVHYAFQKLYASSDVDSSVNEILAMVGKELNVSRVYVFENSPDNRCCNNTFEWCNVDVRPEIENLQGVCYETDIPGYLELYDERGLVYCSDITTLPKAVYDILAPQNIKSLLHCAIRDKGVFRGYIGFDECHTNRFWTKEQIEVLGYFSEMLSTFLLKARAQEEIRQRASDLNSILDNQNAWIYVIDPDDCRLRFLNAKTRSLAAQAREGDYCYSSLMGLESRCPGCPAQNIREKKNARVKITNRKFGLDVLSEATLINWGGSEACLLTCRRLDSAENEVRDKAE